MNTTTSLQNPYATEPGQQYLWLKGNLHTHSNRSDGSRPMQEVIDAYAKLKYDFLAMTDHDIFADYRDIDPRGLILIPGNEVTAFGCHILQLGGTRKIEPARDRQQVISQIVADGGVAVLNHPNWQEDYNHCPLELMQSLQGYAGIEIINGECITDVGSGFAIDKWDQLLSSGRIVWGFANDDSHWPENDGRAWNMVLLRKDQATATGILAALREGRFYASSGVRIDAIETRGPELRIAAADAQQIEIYGDHGVRLASAESSELRFNAQDATTPFVRAQLYGRGSAMAWTQPLMLRGGIGDRRRAMEARWAAPDAARPTLTALRVARIPPLDSKEAEAAWASAPAADVFYDAKSADQADVSTELRAMVSGDELALRVICHEPLMDQIRPRITENGNASLWSDESAQLFLDIEGTRKRYYQLTINPLGAWFISDSMGWSQSAKWSSAAWKEADFWIVEFRLDLATLVPGLQIQPGAVIGLHVSRNRVVAGRRYVWSWTGSSNHVPGRFGTLRL